MNIIRSFIAGLVLFIIVPYFSLFTFQKACLCAGWYLRRKTSQRKLLLLDKTREIASKKRTNRDSGPDETTRYDLSNERNENSRSPKHYPNQAWGGVIGFFHPFCNAGGGGERVLWASIQAVQSRWPNALCVVYTGDHDVTKEAILERVKGRFDIQIDPAGITFIYLSTRYYVLASTWPHFTLLGQSLGSLFVAFDAFSMLVPDILVDTMGYAFVLALSKALFPEMPTGAYVHYPTISTDMLSSLGEDGQGLNAGAGVGTKGLLKRWYWEAFALFYSFVGSTIDVVATNSSWTQNHIRQLWGERRKLKAMADVKIIYPPVAVEGLEKEIDISLSAEQSREAVVLYIAQFRPEKNHALVLEAFSKLIFEWNLKGEEIKLVLIGSVRDKEDATRVYQLRLLAHELKLKDKVEFVCDATWPQVLSWLRKSSIGVNGMWNEHFGIGIVEYQAAGLISVVHDSGGPKQDIVVDVDGKPTGFHATGASEYAARFVEISNLSVGEKLEMRLRARKNARRFSEAVFSHEWVSLMGYLIDLYQKRK